MAKEKIIIDTSGAVRSLEKLQTTVQKYNTVVREGVSETRKQNKATKDSTTSLERLRTSVKTAADTLRTITRQFTTASTHLQNISTSSRSAARSFYSLATNAAVFVTNFGNASQTVNSFRRELNLSTNALLKDTRLTQASTLVMRSFNTQMIRAVDIMREKNKKLQAQSNYVKQDQDAVDKNTKSITHLHSTWQRFINLARDVLFATIVHRTFLRTIQSLLHSIEEAREFSIKVAEITTIQGRANLTTRDWENSLIRLAAAYGIDAIEAAEAAYQTLSNQITDASRVTSFLKNEVLLAVATVSDLDTAVSATTSALNAYGYSSSRAFDVNAILFKTVELGRLRLSDFAETLGNVSILSQQLNITLVEQQAAITLLTRQGVKADAAMTLLRNVELRLIKPTKEMTELFKEWGVTSGANAVQTFGLVGVLNRLWEAAARGGDEMADLGDILGQLRSIVGFTGLRTREYSAELKKFETSGREAFEAYKKVVASTGKQLEIEFTRARAFFIQSFGSVINDVTLNLIKRFDNLTVALSRLKSGIRDGAAALAIYIASSKLVSYSLASNVAATVRWNALLVALSTPVRSLILLFQRLTSVTVLLNTYTLIFNRTALALRATLYSVFTAVNVATVGIAALAYGIYLWFTRTQRTFEAIQRQGLKVRQEFEKIADIRFYEISGQITDIATAFENATNETFRFANAVVANLRAAVNVFDVNAKKAFLNIGKAIKDGLSDPLDRIKAQFDVMRGEIERLKASAERLRESSKERGFESAITRKREAIDLAAAGSADPEATRLKGLFALRQELYTAALNAQRRGEVDLMTKLFDEAEKLHGEITTAYKRQLDEASRATEIKVKRLVPFINPFTGRRTTRTVTTTLPGEVDKEARDKLLAHLVELEKQRAEIVNTRIKAEEAFASREEARARAKEAELKIREAAYERLTNILSEIDSFNTEGPDAVNKYRLLLKQAEKTSLEAGLDPAARLTLLRQARAQELVLERQVAVQIANERLRIATDNINTIQEKLRNAAQERRDLQTELASVVFQRVAPDLAESLGQLEGFLDRARIRGADKGDQTIPQLLERINKLKESISTTDLTPAGLINFRKQINLISKDIDEFDKKTIRFKEGTKFATFPRDTASKSLKLSDDKTIQDIRAQFDRFTTEITTAQNRLIESIKKEGSLESILQNIQQQLDQLPEHWKRAAQESIKEVNSQTNAQRSLNEQLTQTITLLKSLETNNPANIGGGAFFVPPKAFGGRIGFDQHVARVREGEIINTRSASQRFAPFLHAINAMSPDSRPRSVGNVTFGDVNLTVPQGTTDVQVDRIIKGLQRRIRQGSLTI